MRNWIKLAEAAGEQKLIHDLVWQVRNQYAPDFQGSCEGAAGDLVEALHHAGIEAEAVEGRYDAPMDWGDGTTHPFTPHWWVETPSLILDPTREQFGDDELVTAKGDPHYLYGGVGQID